MNKTLFINHSIKQCGVYQYGLRLFNILNKSNNVNYIYKELNNYNDYLNILDENKDLTAIIYNYHNSTMTWLNENNIQRNVLNIGLLHESQNIGFEYVIDDLPRPIYEDVDDYINEKDDELDDMDLNIIDEINAFIDYKQEETPIFGSFGFGFKNKGFHKIIQIINERYDNAIIKLVVPVAYYSNPDMYIDTKILLSYITKPNIKLLITKHFFTNKQILRFLKSNTLNIFLYDEMIGRGISSVIDYALSVDTPFCISNSNMFRHIYTDDICLYKKSIEECIINSQAHRLIYLDKYSHKNICNNFDNIILNKSYSYSYQDLFVISALNKKENGYFLEIGSHHPITNNNSYLLENKYNWSGLLVEYLDFSKLYEENRKNSKYVIQDARTVNYYNLFKKYNFPNNMDYLQIDLDVDNKSTLDTLRVLDKTIFDEYKFATVTFEHDIYRGNFFNTRDISRKIFRDRGYILLFPDISTSYMGNTNLPYEDWYVHPDLVDKNFIDNFKTEEAIMDKNILSIFTTYK